MGVLLQFGIALTTFVLCIVETRGLAGNVKLVAMNGNQYWFSTSSPYAPTLNFHLAYQYCRTLGLQLSALETTEEVETISAFLNKDSNPMAHNKYWTSGNRLGAESWIWLNSGEQMNSSFADYWLKNGVGVVTSTDNPRYCMSMKPPISSMTKRAIFTAEECNKPLPFICEQVRCLYYNYPVMQFPDPSELRTDIEDGGTPSSPIESESRTSVNYSTSEKIRSKNFIPVSGRNKKTSLYDIVAAESGRIDASKIQRRMTLRPVMPIYPLPLNYDYSYYKYNTTSSENPETTISTKRPSFFKKTTNGKLWGPNSAEIENKPPTKSFSSLLNKKISGNFTSTKKPAVYVTPASFIKTSSIEELSKKYPHSVEIVTSKSTTVDGQEVTDVESEDSESSPTMLYHRYGTGTNPSDADQIFGSGYVTDSSVIFDDEENNVGSEVDTDATTITPNGGLPNFFQGSGIRSPDMTGTSQEIEIASKFNKNKSSWSKKEATSSSAAILPNTSSALEKMGLGPRLKLRLRTNNN